MKPILLVVGLFIITKAFPQCPYTANLTSSGECPGAALTVGASKNISTIVWMKDGVAVSTVTAVSTYDPNGITVAGGHGPGLADNQLNFPQGIYVGADGGVLVADANNNRVQAWAPGATAGITVASSYGVGTDPLVAPMDVFPDGYGNYYVSNYTRFRVEKWTFGFPGVTVAGGNGGGSGANQFDFPVGIFLDLNGNLYVADINNHRVQKWASGATTGVTVAGGNGPGAGANQLQFPTSVYVDGSGNVYVVDDFNHRVQRWAPGATSGVTVAGGNGAGAAANQLKYPYGVYVDGNGNIFVADAGNNRVQEWKPGATSGITVAGGNGAGAAANQLNDPRFVWMDANGNLYVSEDQNHRVQKFSLQSTINTSYTASSPGVYTAAVTYSTGCTTPTNAVTILGAVTPSIHISASANPVNLCTNVAFTATVDGTGSNPSLQWQVNGVNVGANQPTYQSGSLQNGDVVTCIVTPTSACVSHAPVSSNGIVIGVNALPQAEMITKNSFCPGDTLAITSGDSLTQIVWMNNTVPQRTVTSVPPGAGITVAGGNGVGPGANQVSYPISMFVDGKGNVYVADIGNWRVQQWAPGATSGVSASGYEQLLTPVGLAVDAAGNVYVVANEGTVEKFVPGATSGVVVAGGHGLGSDADQLHTPVSLFVDAAGNLYVADFNNYRVQKWAPGATSGVTVAGGNGPGPANNQCVPTSIFVDAVGNLYVADFYNFRVQKWAPGATSGVTILSAPDMNFGPRGIWVTANGDIYLTNGADNSVVRYAAGTTKGVTVAGGNGAGAGANQLNMPGSVYVDAKGVIYVADYLNSRVQKFLPHSTIDTVYRATAPGTYTAAVTTSGGCVLTTNAIVVHPFVSPGVSVDASSTGVCSGTPVTLTASPVNGGTAPVYQWQVNGVDAGTNSPIFTTALPDGVSNIVCKMTGNAECALQPSAASSPVAITVSPAVTPAISISAVSTDICSGEKAVFNAQPVNGGTSPGFQWLVNGNPAGDNSPDLSTSSLANGDVITCLLSSNASCVTPATAVSNPISMKVNTAPAPTIDITATPDPVCSGKAVTFTTRVTNGGAVQRYQWQVNGMAAGTNSPRYTTTGLSDGDEVTCRLTTDNVCAAAVSNIVIMTVNPNPVIPPNQVFTSTLQGVVLTPVVNGDIDAYTWTPAAGLSDVNIPNPIANPARSSIYTLTVVSTDGCIASGEITVKVYSDIRIPGAFTPNGDGKNDIFYVLGGPMGSTIKDFSVFDRWGTMVFHVHDVAPGDASFGWNGYYKGVPANAGTYVYALTMAMAGGGQQVFKGTVILVR